MAVRAINASRFAEILEQWKKDCLQDNDQQSADVISDVILQLDDMPTLTPPNEPLSVLVNDEPDREYIDYICPRCKSIISQRRRGQRMETVYKCKFHDNCGQRVDWSNPQHYRRPPEGEDGDADRG